MLGSHFEGVADLIPLLEEANLPQHAVLFPSFEPTAYLYFPVDAIIALTSKRADGQRVQVAPVGREGMAGVHVVLESEATSLQAVVQTAGLVWRAPTKLFQGFVSASPEFRRLLLRYTDAFFTDIAHTATCNSMHP